jgi:hypothetical protein
MESQEHNDTRSVAEKVGHGPTAYWDNLGEGWRIDCLCGWLSGIGLKLQEVAEEFDDHLEEVRP